jgi:predicted nucleic acid-binding protein
MNSAIEPLYIADTNALIWYLTGSTRLGERAKEVFTAAERGETLIYIPAIAIAELYYADKKWRFFNNFESVYHNLKNASFFRLLPMIPEEILEFDNLNAIPEMHDRLIAGVAKRLDAPLLTNDRLIEQSKLVRIVW